MLRLFSAFLVLLVFISGSYAQDGRKLPSGRVMMILDGSNSMWGRLQGEPKIAIAKEVMTDLINDWDDNVPLGLMIYGHRKKKDCQDIEIVSRPGKVDRKSLVDKVQSISPRGKTPINLSLTMASAELLLQRLQDPSIPRDAKTALVLVSDGLETCSGDPCATARDLKVTNPGMDVHVIGFDVTNEESRALQCISDNTGGKFFRAGNADELQAALKETVKIVSAKAAAPAPAPIKSAAPAKPEPSQFVYAKFCDTCERIAPDKVTWNIFKDGGPFFQGSGVFFPNDPVLTPGTYEVATRFQSTVVTAKGTIEIGPDGKQIGALNLNGGSARLFAYATDDKTIAASPIFYQFFPIVDGKAAGKALTEAASSDAVTWLPAGRYKVVASHDQVKESAEIEIVAGEETKHDFDMRVGYLQPAAVLTAGGTPLGGDVDYRIYTSEASAKDSYANGIAFITGGSAEKPLKPGTYYVKAFLGFRGGLDSMHRIFPVEVKANEVARPVFDMQAGALSHTVASKAGNRIINIDYVRESDGARVHYFNAGTSNTLALPEGSYHLHVMIPGGKTFDTDPFQVTAGQVTNVDVSIP